MMKKQKQTKINRRNCWLGVLCLVFLCVFFGCSPVNRFTFLKLKYVPAAYKLNYNIPGTKARSSIQPLQPWIVFADRNGDHTLNRPGGKVPFKKISFLDPFLVIGKKGDFLQLIKYTPAVLKGNLPGGFCLLDDKKTEYYGWINTSHLVLSKNSLIDIKNGKPIKAMTLLVDTLSALQIKKCLRTDSVQLYKDMLCKEPSKVLPWYSLLYPLKESEDGKQVLVSITDRIDPTSIANCIPGWIQASLLQSIGTGLHWDYQNLPKDSLPILKHELKKKIEYNQKASLLSATQNSVKYAPIYRSIFSPEGFNIHSSLIQPVLYDGNNYILNVDGNPIRKKEYPSICHNLKHINIEFVFNKGAHTIAKFPSLINAIQSLQSLFEPTKDNYIYRFGAEVSFGQSGTDKQSKSIPLHSDLGDVEDKLMTISSNNYSVTSDNFVSDNWQSLEKAVHRFDKYPNQNNIIILFGERGFKSEAMNPTLLKSFINNNCRLLACQLYSDTTSIYNDFVLRSQDIIDTYAEASLHTKGKILVSPDQLRHENRYKESGSNKNVFKLDFPKHSITQGYILFPAKGNELPLDLCTSNIDSLIQQVKADNDTILSRLQSAFKTSGRRLTCYDSVFTSYLHLPIKPPGKFVDAFSHTSPGYYAPISSVRVPFMAKQRFRMLLNEDQMKQLKTFVKSLSSVEVEYITPLHKNSKKDKNKKKPVNRQSIPEGKIFLPKNQERKISGNNPEVKYINTFNVRRNIYSCYMNGLKQYLDLTFKQIKHPEWMSVAHIQTLIIGCPAWNEDLYKLPLYKIKNKKYFTDQQLDQLVTYFKKKKKELEKSPSFKSNGQTYYWVECNLLP